MHTPWGVALLLVLLASCTVGGSRAARPRRRRGDRHAPSDMAGA
ncbi:hypothetical protein [Streptomyces sp. NPDC056987]